MAGLQWRGSLAVMLLVCSLPRGTATCTRSTAENCYGGTCSTKGAECTNQDWSAARPFICMCPDWECYHYDGWSVESSQCSPPTRAPTKSPTPAPTPVGYTYPACAVWVNSAASQPGYTYTDGSPCGGTEGTACKSIQAGVYWAPEGSTVCVEGATPRSQP